MGIVYEAERQSSLRRVALKAVRGGQFVDEAYLRMFRRKATFRGDAFRCQACNRVLLR